MKKEKTFWDSRMAFILASMGSAIGLGNIWRFPFICYKHGGGAFLIAYLIALFIAGIPLLLLEFALGYRTGGSAPFSFSRIKFVYKAKEGNKEITTREGNFEWIGWFALFIGFFITTYYTVIMGWSVNYVWHSIKMSWVGFEGGTEGFFYKNVLHLTRGVFDLGKIQIPIVIGLFISWVWIILSIWKGAKTVSKVVYVTVALPWLLLIVFVIRGVLLPGAMEGIRYYLIPNFNKLLDMELWHAAFSQVFFSLSVGFGVMIAYASFLPPRSDIANNAIIIALADAATAYVGGFAVFSALGYYAHILGKPVSQVLKSGPHLAFVTYPEIISKLPLAPLFGVLFFLMLLTLAIDSAFSLVEGVVAGLMDKFGIKRSAANIGVGVVAFLIGLIFTTGAGLYWLDITDHFMNFFGLFVVGFLEAVVVAYAFSVEDMRKYINSVSEVKVGKWWSFSIKYVVPLVSLLLLFFSLREILYRSYGGYPALAVFLGGWLPLIISILGAYFLTAKRIPWRGLLILLGVIVLSVIITVFNLFSYINKYVPPEILLWVIFVISTGVIFGGIIFGFIKSKR